MKKLVLVIFMLFFLTACASWLAPKVKPGLSGLREGQYTLDNNHASLLFKVTHLGLSSYVGRFNKFDASLDFDPVDITRSRLEAIIDMASIDVNNQEFSETLAGDDWLNAEQFPQAIFKTITAKKINESRAIFTGELTFLGITKPLDVTVDFRGSATNMLNGRFTVGFEAHTLFKRSDFGLDKYIPLVGDEITIEVHAEFTE